MRVTGSAVTLTIWNSDDPIPADAGVVYRWDGFAEAGSIHSILRYVEDHAEPLRAKYLAWIHDFGETRIDGQRLIDLLSVGDGLSYWWLTPIFEKNVYSSSSTSNAIRLCALEEIIDQRQPDRVRVVSADCTLQKVIARLCRSAGISYEWKHSAGESRPLSLRALYRKLPQSAQALVYLVRYLRINWPFRMADRSHWNRESRSLFVCSYFDNLDRAATQSGRFLSHYWTGLPELLRRMGLRGNWLQLFIPCADVPDARAGMNLAVGFNVERDGQGFHTFHDSYLSWSIVARVLKGWLRLSYISWRLGGGRIAFQPRGSKLALWPCFRRDWYCSMRGAGAISNLLSIELFDAALRDLPHQKRGLYLCENQPWERALIYAWRKYKHGELIAVPHATVRFWDIRYFCDDRDLTSTSSHPIPQPDLTALNGNAAVEAYRNAGYPDQRIVECEALRYNYLAQHQAFRFGNRDTSGSIEVLVLGDVMGSATEKALRLLELASVEMPSTATYAIKPHPNYLVNPDNYPSLKLKVVTESLANVLKNFTVAYASNATSAAVDAYLAGLRVVIMLDGAGLNLSPLRGQSGVRFVSTPRELARTLQAAPLSVSNRPVDSFFYLDPDLPRWTHLLAN